MLTVRFDDDDRRPLGIDLTAGELYHAQAVHERGRLVYVVRDDNETSVDLDADDFRASFAMVKGDGTAYREAHTTEQLNEILRPFLAEATRAFRTAIEDGNDRDTALVEAMNRVGASIREAHLLTDNEWERLGEILGRYPFEDHLEEHRAPTVVERLIRTRAPAASLLSEGDQITTVRRERYSYPTRVDFGPRGINGCCVMHDPERRLVRDLQPGDVVNFTDEQGARWVVRREGDVLLFDSSARGLRGRVDLKAISPFLYDAIDDE